MCAMHSYESDIEELAEIAQTLIMVHDHFGEIVERRVQHALMRSPEQEAQRLDELRREARALIAGLPEQLRTYFEKPEGGSSPDAAQVRGRIGCIISNLEETYRRICGPQRTTDEQLKRDVLTESFGAGGEEGHRLRTQIEAMHTEQLKRGGMFDVHTPAPRRNPHDDRAA